MESANKEAKSVMIKDKRMVRHIGFRSKKEKHTILLQDIESFSTEDKQVRFIRPNNVSLCLSISNKEYKKASELYYEVIKAKFETGSSIEFEQEEIPILYDYFEHIQTALIFMYTAIEAFTNLSIPRDYRYEKKKNKDVTEVYLKSGIERRISTSEKLINILPGIFKVESPKTQDYWSQFEELEDIRNNIIHQKTITDMKVFERFLDEEIFRIIKSGFRILEYFCSESEEPHIPVGIGLNKVKIFEVEKFEDYIKVIE